MSNVSEFIWKGFDEKHISFPESQNEQLMASMERMMEPKFIRNYTVYRISHFSSRIVTLDDDFQLPNNSILHIADNFEHLDDFDDLPRVDSNIFVQRETYRKWIYHVKELNTTHFSYPDKFILRFAGLPTKLMKFRSEHGNEFRYLNKYSEFPHKREALIIVNHNPLFRMRLFGRLQFFRKFQQIFASILNTCEDLTFLGKHQFIFIPWGDEFFDKAQFFRSRDKLDMVTVRKPENLHYLFMMHILNFLWDTATTSILKNLSEEALKQIYLVPNIDGRYIFYNLATLLSLNDKNFAYRRVTNQLNLLSMLARKDAEDHPLVKTLLNELNADAKPTEPQEEVTHEKVVAAAPEHKLASSETEKVLDTIDKETKDGQDITHPSEPIRSFVTNAVGNIVKPKLTPVSYAVPSAKNVAVDTQQHISRIVNTKRVVNTTKTDASAIHDIDNFAKDYLRDVEAETNEFIDNREDLTPRAKEHFKKVAQKYKELTIDGVTLDKLLTDNNDIKISDSILDEKQLGVVPDKSELSSTLANFDKDYIKNTYKKHIAGIVTSFQKEGVYLIGLKTEKVVNDLDNYTLYTCQYEDILGRKSTAKFKMPDVTSNGTIMIDGIPNVVKKQRTALPIAKISDTVVSLASNYNKTRVIRNTNKAHNFYAFIHSFLNDKTKSTANIVYGNNKLNLAISYEYCALAERYNRVDFKGSDGNIYRLNFEYEKRLEDFSGKPELLNELEGNYGVYFGSFKDSWLFIDVDNVVHAVNKRGGENTDFTCSSMIDVMKLALRPEFQGKIKSLTEWVTIKILDLAIPVMFVLCYRYGLRHMLDYLGIKYTITENRSKTIVGENVNAAATESFGVNSDDYIGQDDVIVGTENFTRPVKPRLGDVTLYLTVKGDANYDNKNVQVRAFIFTVKLGRNTTVTRRITNYDGSTFITNDLQTAPRDLAEKASEYLRCSLRKVTKANLQYIPADKSLPPNVANTKRLAPIEYKKMTSKLNIDENKVKPPKKEGNESFDIGIEELTDEAKYTPKSNDIHIRFADRVLHFNRYPLAQSLIVAGLDQFDLSKYDMSEFESKDVYYRVLQDKRLSTNYLKGIDSFFDLFVDNMTYTVLKMMHEPTNVRDLLIRSAVLLSTTDHVAASSAYNHRIRGYEQFAAILYNEMSREFANYQTRRGSGNVFSINPDAVYLRIIQNESMVPAEAPSPLEDIKLKDSMTYSGIGGRTGESFVVSDRRFDESDVGVISEATADSGRVGMNAMLTFNPTIKSTMGLITPNPDVDKTTPSEAWSIHALTFPFSTNDDGKRINFISIQSSHLIPTVTCDRNRVRTGYERIIAHHVGRTFAGVAERDGKVTNIDEKAMLVEVTYDNGDTDVFPYGDIYNKCENFEMTQNVVVDRKLGEKFKKGDIITHNANYFYVDHDTKQVDFTTGIMANVAMMEHDTTLEDSCEIGEKLSQKLTIHPVQERPVVLSAKSYVHMCKQVGDVVTPTDELMIFEADPTAASALGGNNAEALAMLSELNRDTPHARCGGTIVKIDAYYGCDISEMSDTVANIVKPIVSAKNRRSKIASKSDKASEYPSSSPIAKGKKFKGVEFDADTVLLVFHIRETIPHGVGDKLVFCNQLKCTCGSVFTKPVYTESGVEIDALFSQSAQNKRVVLSPILIGISSRVLEKLEDEVCEDYFGTPRDKK